VTSPSASVPLAESLHHRPIELLIREDIKNSSAPMAAEILGNLGFEVRRVPEKHVDLSPDRILLVRGSPLWYRRTLSRVAALEPERRPCVVVWHTEALPNPASSGLPNQRLTLRELAKIALRDRRINDHFSNGRYFRHLDRLGIASVLTVANGALQAYLAEHGIATELVPVGYHPSYGYPLGLERDIDVLFLGEYQVPRRRRILRRLDQEGVDVRLLGSQSPKKGYWGDARNELLNRTKILLHIARYPGQLSDRIIMGMSTGALVVAERIYLPDPFVPGVHYVDCSIDELSGAVQHYLADEDERLRITREAYRFLTEELRMEQTYIRLMELAAECCPHARSSTGELGGP
jgi:glycosyltransferase involved in cell wall biosynthesis